MAAPVLCRVKELDIHTATTMSISRKEYFMSSVWDAKVNDTLRTKTIQNKGKENYHFFTSG